MIKKDIFTNRLKYPTPDVLNTENWCHEVFEWLFGRAEGLEFEGFLKEELRLQSQLTGLINDSQACYDTDLSTDQKDTKGGRQQLDAATLSRHIFQEIEELYPGLQDDLESLYAADPAAKSRVEIIAAYPGFYAVVLHRIAHLLWKSGATLVARLMAEFVHSRTGIDIHPGAEIGARFVIDHGTGVVIGETTVIGDDVKVYQGVTLGALSVNKEDSDIKRHPTIGNQVVIYANATILGGETHVGDQAVIGGNVWLTRSVPANSLVYHKSEMVIKSSTEGELPEPINFVI